MCKHVLHFHYFLLNFSFFSFISKVFSSLRDYDTLFFNEVKVREFRFLIDLQLYKLKNSYII